MYPSLHWFSLDISSYFLLISLATIGSVLWFLRRAGEQRTSHLFAIDLTLVVLVCGFVGSRLLHVFYEEPAFYFQAPLRVLAIWQGGFVFLGGLLGAMLGAWVFCDQRREPLLFWADLAAPPAALAYAIGRVACFLNGCCYGRHCDLPWGIAMSQDGNFRHPTQLYASGWELVVLGILLMLEKRLKGSGAVFASWLMLHAVGRLIMEHFRDDPRGGTILNYSLGAWMSAGLLVCGSILLVSLFRPATKSGP